MTSSIFYQNNKIREERQKEIAYEILFSSVMSIMRFLWIDYKARLVISWSAYRIVVSRAHHSGLFEGGCEGEGE